MIDLRAQLSKAQLYLVMGGAPFQGRTALETAEKAIQGGVDILQLRERSLPDSKLLGLALRMRELARKYKVLFLVNDRPDIARLSEADGVHLGQDDLSVEEARAILKEGKLVGVSTHALDQAKKALKDGADYIGVGPVFSTPTKAGRPAVTVDYVRQVAALNPSVPFFAIGGIDLSSLPAVLEAGAWRVAMVRAIAEAKSPGEAAARFKTILEKYPLSAIEEDRRP
jgi:thiamine-phosphate pyrophosphorylase